MNSSELYQTACSYLGVLGEPDAQMLSLVQSCLDEALSLSRFRATSREYREPLEFLRREPYAAFLSGCTGYALVAMTLGTEVEKRIRQLMLSDASRAVVLDACASALVEYEGDRWEERFGEERTYRFCPGYGGSSIEDIAVIFSQLRPERIGMQLLPSGLMAPQKSMAGIVGIGKCKRKACGECMLRASCVYLKEGKRCFRSENVSS